mmetsp:Transcript_46704/g.113730  ORF Transcript_46704/g.113730 Transcript_46704/m.113730 type:complete len:242 (+) Transcript_46704:182-907(+)
MPGLLQRVKAARQASSASPSLLQNLAACGSLVVDRKQYAKILGQVYFIVAQLEACLERHQSNAAWNSPGLKELLVRVRRTEAFETDLRHLLGNSWRSCVTRTEAVDEVLERLRWVDDEDPAMLLAYAADVYLGMLAMRDLRIKPVLSFANGLKAGRGAEVFDCACVTYAECRKVFDSLELGQEKEARFVEESLRLSLSMKAVIDSVSLSGRAIASPLVQSLLVVLLGAFLSAGFFLVRMIQ